jgi:hypothetical protein
MSAQIWLPPTWRSGVDSPEGDGYQDEPWTTGEVAKAVQKYQGQGYLTPQRKPTPKAEALDHSSSLYRSIVDAAHNVDTLRNAWNTPAKSWLLAARFLPAMQFTVDPMHNPGTDLLGLPGLQRTLDGSTPEQNGYAIDESRSEDVLASLSARGLVPGKNEGFPALWRGKLKKGKAAAAVNGPHSDTETWLALCDAYGQEEFCAAFCPYAGDKWLWDVGFRAPIVIHLGRAKCAPPPGIEESSPRGPSLLLLWVPPAWLEPEKLVKLPTHTQRVLRGETFKVPYARDARGYVKHALVTPGRIGAVVDLGMLEIEGRA